MTIPNRGAIANVTKYFGVIAIFGQKGRVLGHVLAKQKGVLLQYPYVFPNR